MKDININKNTNIIPMCNDINYNGSTEISVLIFHGFTGCTAEMDYLGKRIHDDTGYSVYIPRLPGHGTSSRDFRQSKARDWLRRAYDSYLEMKLKYDRVYVAGLSMGGLLALLTSARFNPEKLVLIAPALYAQSPLVPFTHILKFFLPAIKQKDSTLPDDSEANEEQILHHQHYYTNHYTAQVAELHKIMRLARKKLSLVQSDTYIIGSKSDKQVPLKAVHTVKEEISSKSKQLFIYQDSPHVINNGPDKKDCADRIINFLIDCV